MVLGVALSGAALASCGGDDGTADAATSSPPAPIDTSVPEGTTLRVADQ